MVSSTIPSEPRESRRLAWSIGTQLLLSVNGVLILLAAAFLTYDYHRDLQSRLDDKRIALHEEAKTMMPAVLLMQQLGRESIQQYVDAVCGRMRDAESPGHHIIVKSGKDIIQANAHHRASPEILRAIQKAARESGQGFPGNRGEFVVGTYSESQTTVYVSETLDNIRRSVVGDVILRLIGLIVLAAVATAVVDYVLWRVVWRPVKRLVVTVQDIAKGNLGVQTEKFRSRELDFLATEINAMSTTLAAVDNDRTAQMARAREIQQSLLPKDIDVAGFSFATLFLPAEDVAGDYYDIVRLSDGTDMVCIADVTGHGVPAAMNAMMLKVLLVEACERHNDPAEILEFINRRLAGVCRTDGFVTMFVARFDTRRMVLQYASAGHESGLFLPADGELTELPSTGLVLGIVEDEGWTAETVAIHRGDRLLLVTDGVTEAMNPHGEMFGRKRLASSYEACRNTVIGGTLEQIGNAVADYCEKRPFSDDVTAVALEVTTERPLENLQRIEKRSLESGTRR